MICLKNRINEGLATTATMTKLGIFVHFFPNSFPRIISKADGKTIWSSEIRICQISKMKKELCSKFMKEPINDEFTCLA